MADLLFKEQVDFILSKGEGIKCMLFDSKSSRQIVNNIIPYSTLLDNDYFYFDYLPNKKRTRLNICCVVVIADSNLKLLIEEMVDPFYSSYIILFRNVIDPFVLEILAGADRNGVIREIHEINLGVVKEDDYLYRGSIEELASILNTLEIQPTIQIQTSSKFQSNPGHLLASDKILSTSANSILLKTIDFKKSGSLLILDRSFDLITPLLCDWFYQSAIHQVNEYENSTCTLPSTHSPKSSLSFNLSDHFFRANKFENLQNVGINLKGIVKELETKKLSISNCQFDDIEGATEHSKMVEAHLTIYTRTIDECMRNQEVSEREIAILKSDDHSQLAKGSGESDAGQIALVNSHLRPNLKLQMIRGLKTNNFAGIQDEYLRYVERFRDMYRPINFPYKYSFNSDSELLSYESPLKRILRHFVRNKLNASAFKTINASSEGRGSHYIIYVNGGITYREYRDVMKQSEELNVRVYLVSDKLIKYKTILGSIID